jgi:MFS family permease
MLPLTRLSRAKRHGWKTLIFFGGLGIGYMWTELALIHSFVFYLGQPVYAASLVVGVLLIGSAIGSALTGRFTNLRPWRWAAVVAFTLALYALLLPPMLQTTLLLSLLERFTLAVLILLPAAVVMGMPFPLGLRLLNQVNAAEVPWAWGINGCFSVVGAAVATLIAVEAGYSLLLMLAACAYLAPLGLQLRDKVCTAMGKI